jgi:hypothetical protein
MTIVSFPSYVIDNAIRSGAHGAIPPRIVHALTMGNEHQYADVLNTILDYMLDATPGKRPRQRLSGACMASWPGIASARDTNYWLGVRRHASRQDGCMIWLTESP